MWPDMIFGFVSRWVGKRVHPNIQKPIYACTVCMSMWYGSTFYWIIWGNSWQEWLTITFCSMGANAIIVSFLPKD